MKIVKRIEDIQPAMWCRATEENFNSLRKLGLDSGPVAWKEISGQLSFLNTDILLISSNFFNYFSWHNYADGIGEEFTFNQESQEHQHSLLSRLGFTEPETFKAEIFKIFGAIDFVEYIGVVNKNIPAKWLADGTCVNPGKGYTLYKEYKQRIYTKLNSLGFNPKQKFKISWTEKMSLGLEQSGWRLASNEEIENFKDV